MTTKQLDAEYLAHTYARFPVEIVSGRGSILTDETGKEYIDLGTGIAVNIFGMHDAAWIEAVTAQLDKFQHTSNLYYTAPCAQLAQMLCEKTGMKRVFFSNSGAEANECAIKAARQYAAQKHGDDCYTIITLKNSFHGRTITTLAATGQDHYHEQFRPLTPGFVYAEANNLASVEALMDTHKIAAVMFEAIQGEGGVVALDKEFLQALAGLAAERDILLIADEVQAGNGRSGELYAYMHAGIKPDIVSTAKGIGGGLPLGVTMFGEKTQDVYQPGMHGSTFGGNPVCCAGAISILSRLDDAMLAGVRAREQRIRAALTGAPGVEAVTGLGLMLGVKTAKPAKEVVNRCMEKGVLVLTAKDRVRLLPALNIPMDVLDKAISILREACEIK